MWQCRHKQLQSQESCMFITINAKNYLYHFLLTTSHRKFDQAMIRNQYLQVGSESTGEPNGVSVL